LDPELMGNIKRASEFRGLETTTTPFGGGVNTPNNKLTIDMVKRKKPPAVINPGSGLQDARSLQPSLRGFRACDASNSITDD
jgi:hypothetical protein